MRRSNAIRRIAVRAVVPILISFSLAVLLFLPALAEARAGGGEGFTYGDSGSGGDGGGVGGFFLYLLFQLAIKNPVVGIPLLILVVIFFLKAGKKGYSGHVSRSIRTGYRIQSDLSMRRDETGLDGLRARDPDFSPESFISRCSGAFLKIQNAWSRQDMRPVRPFLSDGVFERLQLQQEMMEALCFRNMMSDIQVLSCRICGVRSDDFFDTIHLAIVASAKDLMFHTEHNRPLRGRDVPSTFEEVWSFLRRPGAPTLSRPGLLEGYCPNCGTPLAVLDSVDCPSCRAVINSGQYDWVLAEITQSQVWSARPERAVPGLDALRKKDPAFCVQHVEDKASVIFWRHRAAELFASDVYLKKVASPAYLERARGLFQPLADGKHRLFLDAAVGSVEIMDILLSETPEGTDSLRVKINWSGHREDERIPGFLPPDSAKSSRFVQEYLLIRNASARSSEKNILTSVHCPGCGAPETRNAKGQCEYCGMPQNDGSTGWVLDVVRPFTGAPHPAGSVYASDVAKELGIAMDLPAPGLPQFSNEENLALFSCLIAVMYADGKIDPREKEQLNKMGSRRNISEKELEGLIATAGRNSDLHVPEWNSPREAMGFLRSLVMMCLADGDVSSTEREIIGRMAQRTGIAAADIDRMINAERAGLYRESRRIRRRQG